MSEPSWTPGPWTVSGHRSVFKEADGIADGHHGYIVAKTITHSLIAVSEAQANARLIASAPELYGALKTLTDKLAALMADSIGVAGLHLNGDVAEWSSLTDGGAYEEWLSGITDARTALRKARGE